MARMKILDERKKKEVERICSQSDELKELQAKIMAAYQNKERAAQITEKQYRQQVNIVSFFNT
jgi:galactokinase/mevalonate kinase-like predicted kinase